MGQPVSLISGLLGLGGAALSSNAAGRAADSQTAAANRAIEAQLAMYNQSRADILPQIQAAQGATNALWGTPDSPAQTIQGAPIYGNVPGNALSGGYQQVYNWQTGQMEPQWVTGSGTAQEQAITGYQPSTTIPATAGTPGMIQAGPGPFKESEGYQWTLGQGMQGLQRQASATGRLGSGAYIKDATKYAEGLASTEYDNFLNRYYKSLEPYFRMMTGGTAAAGNSAQTGTSTANALSLLYSNIGNAQAAGQLGTASPWSQLATYGAGQLGQYAVNALNKYQPPPLSGQGSYGIGYGNMLANIGW